MPAYHALFFAIAIPSLFAMTRHNAADRSLGELSYPIYIVHWPVLMFLAAFKLEQLPLLLATLTSVLALGAFAAIIIDKHVETFRHSLLRRQPGIRTTARHEFVRAR